MTADIVENCAPISSAEQAGEGRLAGAGRSPQEHRGEVAAGDAPAQRPAFADEVLLPDELVQVRGRMRAASGCAPGRRLEQRLRSERRFLRRLAGMRPV